MIIIANSLQALDLHMGGSFVNIGYSYVYDIKNDQVSGVFDINFFKLCFIDKDSHFGLDFTLFVWNIFIKHDFMYFRPLNMDFYYCPVIFKYDMFINLYIAGGLLYKQYTVKESDGKVNLRTEPGISGDLSLGFRFRKLSTHLDWKLPFNFDLYFEYSLIKREIRFGLHGNLDALVILWFSSL
jgi:hypothetical protein